MTQYLLHFSVLLSRQDFMHTLHLELVNKDTIYIVHIAMC